MAKQKNKQMFFVIEHTSAQAKAGVNYSYFSHEAAADSIIESLRENFEIDDDGHVDGSIKVHLPNAKRGLKNESEIRSAMAKTDSIIVSHHDYDVRYDIVEIIL